MTERKKPAKPAARKTTPRKKAAPRKTTPSRKPKPTESAQLEQEAAQPQPQAGVDGGITAEYECSMCGIYPGPVASCELCHGADRYRQERAYTLSEERRGDNPSSDRYGRTGEVGPKIVALPGSWVPGTAPITSPDQSKQ